MYKRQILSHFPQLTEEQIEQFKALSGLYEDWNAKINVISRKDMDQFYTRHVLHSLSIAKLDVIKAGQQVMDVGTGGGFPGIPLAIMYPETEFTLVDSIGKKIKVVKFKRRKNYKRTQGHRQYFTQLEITGIDA